MAMSHFKGMEERPTLCSKRMRPPEREIAYGVDLWRRSAHSTLRAGKPHTWGRGTRSVHSMTQRGACEMRPSATVRAMLQDRGKRGVPVTDLYRQLYNPTLYLRAYGRIYANDGAMTAGSTPETADALTLSNIEKIIDDLRHERYRWTPVRRTYVPKKNGKKRALGLPIVRSYCPPSRVLSGLRCRRGSADSIPARSTVPYFARAVGSVVVSNGAASACAGRR
jgi:hypothetical protein